VVEIFEKLEDKDEPANYVEVVLSTEEQNGENV